jgi:hypothetical protein
MEAVGWCERSSDVLLLGGNRRRGPWSPRVCADVCVHATPAGNPILSGKWWEMLRPPTPLSPVRTVPPISEQRSSIARSASGHTGCPGARSCGTPSTLSMPGAVSEAAQLRAVLEVATRTKHYEPV